MQVTVHDREVDLFKSIANGDRFLTDAQAELLNGFSNRIILQIKDDIFNSKLLQLKTFFQKEFRNGCYGIACSDCKLDSIGTECCFREFKLSLQKIEV